MASPARSRKYSPERPRKYSPERSRKFSPERSRKYSSDRSRESSPVKQRRPSPVAPMRSKRASIPNSYVDFTDFQRKRPNDDYRSRERRDDSEEDESEWRRVRRSPESNTSKETNLLSHRRRDEDRADSVTSRSSWDRTEEILKQLSMSDMAPAPQRKKKTTFSPVSYEPDHEVRDITFRRIPTSSLVESAPAKNNTNTADSVNYTFKRVETPPEMKAIPVDTYALNFKKRDSVVMGAGHYSQDPRFNNRLGSESRYDHE